MATTLGEVVPEPTIDPSSPTSTDANATAPAASATEEGGPSTTATTATNQEPGPEGSTAEASTTNLADGAAAVIPNSAAPIPGQQPEEEK